LFLWYDKSVQENIQVKSLSRQSCANASAGARGAQYFVSVFCWTEELLNRCCFAKGSICLGFNLTSKLSSREIEKLCFVLEFLATVLVGA
jgi:hypothetical protein